MRKSICRDYVHVPFASKWQRWDLNAELLTLYCHFQCKSVSDLSHVWAKSILICYQKIKFLQKDFIKFYKICKFERKSNFLITNNLKLFRYICVCVCGVWGGLLKVHGKWIQWKIYAKTSKHFCSKIKLSFNSVSMNFWSSLVSILILSCSGISLGIHSVDWQSEMNQQVSRGTATPNSKCQYLLP